MKVLVSACLMGTNCKYNGGNNIPLEISEYVSDHEVICVCPKVLGGLTTPRISCEIVKGEVINREGISYDLDSPVTVDFVSSFESKEQYLAIGRGMVIINLMISTIKIPKEYLCCLCCYFGAWSFDLD